MPITPIDAARPKTPHARPEVSVLIVAYNSRDQILRCIAAVANGASEATTEILLVDNGTDGTDALVAEKFPAVRIAPSEGNVGFARGNNILAKHAEAPLLLLLNPDMYVENGAIDELALAAKRYPDAAAWGGVTVNQAGEPDTGNAIAIPSLGELAAAAAGMSLAGRSSQELSRDVEVDVLSGGFVMLSRSAWDAAEGFDESFFLYCEEVDLFQRLRNQSYSIWRIPAARGEHDLGHGNSLSPLRLLFRAGGIMEYVRKHWSPFAYIVGAALIWFGAFGRYAAGRLFGRWHSRLARLGEGYRLVATRPDMWFHGYNISKGLKAKLDRGDLKEK